MDQEKIDRLFREKLDSLEVAPSDKAWNRVQQEIGVARRPIKYYWIAAAVSALIVGWVVWPKENPADLTPIASDVNYPVLEVGPEWSLPLNDVEDQKKEEKIDMGIKQPKAMKQPTRLVAQAPTKDLIEEKVEEVPPREIESTKATMVANVELEKPQMEALEKREEKKEVDFSKVKITYIASKKQEEVKQEKDSVGAFKKLFALAGKISPGDVLADIRTAKDDFINGGFKTNQKDKASL